jgi:hypothetical protein
MCGSDTLTTVVSSTSMKVLDITAMAISQGLISGISAWIDGISSLMRTVLRHPSWREGCLPGNPDPAFSNYATTADADTQEF